ncbi:MAG: aspartate kinase [Planctomycetota bacterium]|nr:MAG: aspartate kinase [Planctomycetota bacterium]
MSLIVQKFGGTSVATPEKIVAAAQRAVAAKEAGWQVVMVVSARGKKTDELVSLAAEMTSDPQPREMDMLLATGEQEAVALMAMAIRKLGHEAVSLTGGQIGIETDSSFTRARIHRISTDRIRRHLNQGCIVVACGFQGVDHDKNITTLGRGGSDTTATALAAALRAEECQIYTDVDVGYTTDPRIVPMARLIPRISYDEMLEMASLGAGVMHSRSIEFAKKFAVPLRVRPAGSSAEGTLIAPDGEDVHRVVTGLARVRDEARVSLSDIPDRPGVMSTIFERMAARKIALDMVVQNVGAGSTAEVSFTVPESELAEALTAADEAVRSLGAGSVHSGTNVSKVSVVGSGMRTHSGVAAQMFKSLAQAGVNIEMITTSEIKISALVAREKCDAALKAVHRGFNLDAEAVVAPSVGVAQTAPAQPVASNDELLEAVVSRLAHMEDIVVSQVRLDERQARITIDNLPDSPGVCAQLFGAVAGGGIMVDMIVQNVSRSGRAEVSFTTHAEELQPALLLVREVMSEWPETSLHFEQQIAKLSVMGIGLRTHTGVGEKMFRALAGLGINVRMINTSEVCTSIVVASDQGQAAHAALLAEFGL